MTPPWPPMVSIPRKPDTEPPRAPQSSKETTPAIKTPCQTTEWSMLCHVYRANLLISALFFALVETWNKIDQSIACHGIPTAGAPPRNPMEPHDNPTPNPHGTTQKGIEDGILHVLSLPSGWVTKCLCEDLFCQTSQYEEKVLFQKYFCGHIEKMQYKVR